MPLIIQCAWCNSVVETKNTSASGELSVSHTVCVACKAKVNGVWDGIERRSGSDRRQRERRNSGRLTLDRLFILDGVVWLETEGRRTIVRRGQDRDVLASRLSISSV